MQCRIVDTPAELGAVCRSLEAAGLMAMDTEFLRVRTYYAKLCLLQVYAGQDVLCIDPLGVDLNIQPMRRLLLAEDQVKILHAARQDIDVLYGIFGCAPRAVFDTQVAAAMLGLGDQIGYAALVEAVTGETLAKAHTRTDWCQRPLTAEQLDYAVDDVRYLPDIYRYFEAELGKRGRLEWVFEECAALSDPNLYQADPKDAYKRMSQGQKLDPVAQGVLKELAIWRERTSQRRDLPRSWVIKDGALLEVARCRPRSLEHLAELDGVSERFAKKHGPGILELISGVVSRSDHPVVWRRPGPLNDGQRALRKKITAHLEKVSKEAGISSQLLVSRQDVDRLVRGGTDVDLLRGWRAQLLGDELNAILA